MILRISEKINKNGWCRQITVDFDNKIIKTGSFQFRCSDVSGITHKQYLQVIDYFVKQGFKELEV